LNGEELQLIMQTAIFSDTHRKLVYVNRRCLLTSKHWSLIS